MLRRRRSEGKNMTKSVMAFFWIALGGVSGLYLFTLLTNPAAFGQASLGSSLSDATSALSGSAGSSLSAARISELLEARDKEIDDIKQQVRDLSQQVADLGAHINGTTSPKPLAANPAPSSVTGAPSEPQVEAATEAEPSQPAKKPEAAAAAPAITPPPPPDKPTPVVKPAEAKPTAPPPVTVAAAEPKPADKAEPKPAASPPSPATTDDDTADSEEKDIPPPVTVSEAEVPPADDAGPSSANGSSGPQGPNPAATESASLDPVVLPPAANDGTTRYGIEIGTVAKQDALRPLWREFLTNHAALVAGLQPRRVLAPDKKWRLIAGPFANAAEATQACALFKKASQPCEATVYAGDSL
jgi:hypothetical protein